MLRDVVIHVNNEQPILADLVEEPTSLDNCVVCTNLRTMSGTTPVFVERSDSTFVIPPATIRFVEIRPAPNRDSDLRALVEVSVDHPGTGKSGRAVRSARPEPAAEDAATARAPSPLQRLDWVGDVRGSAEAGDAGDCADAGDGSLKGQPERWEELEADEGELLRRVREA